MRWVPNLLTCVRIVLTPMITLLILSGECARALPVTVLAGLTDGVDGYFARRFGAMSRVGALLDPAADKLLLTCLYMSFGLSGLIPTWLVYLVVGRDVVILALVAAGFVLAAIQDFPPTRWGKLSTVIQIAGALIFLVGCSGLAAAALLIPLAVFTVAAATLWSGLHYIYRAWVIFHASRAATGPGSHKV